MISTIGILAILHLAFAQDPPARVANLDQHDLQLAMARIATEHPNLATVVPVVQPFAESRGKRRIDALRLEAGQREPGRPAMLIVANVDGPLVWTSNLALDHARALAQSYATDEAVKKLLDTTTIYIIPRADPDAAEARFAKPLHEERASGPGVDDDRDGRAGEDPPRDLDGDGMITWMRVPDGEGEWMLDPLDERALIKADRSKGQRGRWKLMREGRDSDRDEVAAEDQELDAVVNRNFPAGWDEHGRESGRFPTDEPGARALCEFILQHREIALVVTYGSVDNVVEKPRAEGKPGRESVLPSAGIPEADVGMLAEIGRGFAKLGKGMKGDGKDAGTFQAWVQAHRGLWAVHIAPWSVPLDEPAAKKEGEGETKSDAKKDGDPEHKLDGGTEPKQDAATESKTDAAQDAKPDAKSEGKSDGKPGGRGEGKGKGKGDDEPQPSDDAKRLRWMDAKSETARFVPWHAFEHPELGRVEIGGFAPYALIEPPESEYAEIAKKNVDFIVDLGASLPRLKLIEVTAKDLSGGKSDEAIWDVKAVLVNDGYLSYPSALGQRTRAIRPARVKFEPKDAQIVTGERQILVRDLADSGERRELRWLVKGVRPSSMRVTLDTDSAGASSVVPEVK